MKGVTLGSNQSQVSEPQAWCATRLRVPLYEVDLGQGVYHGNYFHLLELGREDFLRTLGFPYKRFMDLELHLTVVEATARYTRPLRYDDEILIRTGIGYLQRRSLAFQQRIYTFDSNLKEQLCNDSVLKMVCVRFSGKPTVIPAEFVQAFETWLSGMEDREGSEHGTDV